MHTHSYTLLIVLFNIISFHTFTEPVNYDEGHKSVIKFNSLDSVIDFRTLALLSNSVALDKLLKYPNSYFTYL